MTQYTAGQLATVALNVMASGIQQASDENLAAVTATRQFLRALAAGQLIVSEPPKPVVAAAVKKAVKSRGRLAT
jgi:hypothetical protein